MDALIFDVDGTLWDTTALCAEAWNLAITENSTLEPCMNAKQLRGLFGKPMNDIFQTVFPTCDEEEVERMSRLCEKYENDLLEEVPGEIYPDVVRTLKRLAKKIPIYIVSNCQKGYIEICMKHLGVEDIVTDHTCYGDCHVSKGQNILRLMKKHGLQTPVYVGDTQGDAQACEEAGIPIIFAAYGFGVVEKPWRKINCFAELETIVE